MDISLNLDELKEEIDFLKRTWRVKKSIPAHSRRADAVVGKKTDPGPSGSSEQRPESVRLLLEWARAVCAFYGIQVRACVFWESLVRTKQEGRGTQPFASLLLRGR